MHLFIIIHPGREISKLSCDSIRSTVSRIGCPKTKCGKLTQGQVVPQATAYDRVAIIYVEKFFEGHSLFRHFHAFKFICAAACKSKNFKLMKFSQGLVGHDTIIEANLLSAKINSHVGQQASETIPEVDIKGAFLSQGRTTTEFESQQAGLGPPFRFCG